MKRGRLIRNMAVGLLAVGLLVVFVYLFVSSPSRRNADGRCGGVVVRIDAHQGGEPLFLSPDGIVDELTRHGIVLKGRPLDSIDLRGIEKTLSSLSVYEQVEAFVSPSSATLQIRLKEKHPLFIVQDRTGKSHYVTEGRGTISVRQGFATYLPVVSGDLDLKYATSDVYDLMAVLRRDSDLVDYFGQVYVDASDGIVLIPRIGHTRVVIGKTTDWEEKLRKWRIFASSVLPRRGMNAFAYVNLDYAGQVVARDRYGVQGFGRDEEGELVRLDAVAVSAEPAAPAPAPVVAAPAPKAESRPTSDKPRQDKPKQDKPKQDKPKQDKPTGTKPSPTKAPPSKPTPTKQPASKPAAARPATTKSTASPKPNGNPNKPPTNQSKKK
jgi:putative cell division protein ftsQ